MTAQYRDPWAMAQPPDTQVVVDGVKKSELMMMHNESFFGFVYPSGFGYIQDRQHVAGFLAHGFGTMPRFPEAKEPETWTLEKLELVSLLKQGGPVAYVSPNLPRMDELRNAKIRPLEPFEKEMLAGLRRGDDLKVEVSPERMRMLGSIRAAKQCLDCHSVERGDLLGAFAYKFRRQQ